MITRLDLEDFQAHGKRSFDLGPVTTVIGPTGSGKSSCVRALYWLAFNLPDGLAFLRHGSESVSASALVDGELLTRTKSKTTNTYTFRNQTYHALGRAGVPQIIQDFLALRPVNFQKQADGYFWFSESSGDVSKSLNDLLDLALVDQSLGHCQSTLRNAQENLRQAQESHRIAQEAREALNWLDPLPEALDALESVLEGLEGMWTEVQEMEAMVVEWEGLEAEWEAGEEWLAEVEAGLSSLRAKYTEWQECRVRAEGARVWLAEWEALEGEPEVSLCPTCLRPLP